jgi:DNA-binding CsgD family transcriptional regulator
MRRPELPPLPLTADLWEQMAVQLKLSPQQKRIVELILRHQCDKQIAARMGIKHPTVRTHINRLFRRLQLADREELILLFFRRSHQAPGTLGVIRRDDITTDD